MKKTLFAILVNLLYWFPRIYYTSFARTRDIWRLYNYAYFGTAICVFYLFYFLLVPHLFYKRKFVPFAIYGAISLVVPGLLIFIIMKLVAGSVYFGELPVPFDVARQMIESAPFVVIPAIGIRIFVDWFSEMHYRRQLEKKNTETELALLKAQINPHFLFNTLNNIDVLMEKDVQKASMYLKELSDILRFMLYESPSEKIVLSKEIAYIRKYIQLQKIRTSNSNFVHFEVTGNTDIILVPPMLFIPFIENAFKHCTNKKIDQAIDVKLTVQQDSITFFCDNAYDVSALQTQAQSGLGLELIRNRLKLLYRDNYKLDIDKTNDRFIVDLTIKTDGD